MILLTGGSGLLGRHLVPLLPCIAPSHAEFDILNPWKPGPKISMIVHAAAYTDVAKAETDRDACQRVNAEGTAKLAALGLPLVYISTEYVFDGARGNYAEDDIPGPCNWYARTKLFGEAEARKAPRSLVIRCLFKPRPFEHPRACVDQWTSGDYVDVIAPQIAQAVEMFRQGRFKRHDTIHIGTGRKTTYDLARASRDVAPCLRAHVPVTLPKDTSLDLTKWKSMQTLDIDFARPTFGDAERAAVNRVMAQHWLASGPENDAFEREFADYIGVPHALACNSGSSANLLALAAMDLPKGEKVITSGCGFPATLSPILHLGLTPVLVDYDMATHNIDVAAACKAMEDPDVWAIILAHTMGNPVDMHRIKACADEHNIWVIEDCCEAAGAGLDNTMLGAWGEVGTFSFYPSHQITAGGGGGMVTFKEERHYQRARSLRDWGKLATWDKGGRNNTEYTTMVDGVPYFPHYTYETVGWNFKLPEMCAAFGRVQLTRLPQIVAQRQENASLLESLITQHYGRSLRRIELPAGSEPSPFGVILTLKRGNRDYFARHLEAKGVRHRPWFAGNITRHKPFAQYRQDFPVADELMRQSVFVGCHAELTFDQINYMADVIDDGLNAAVLRDAA